MRLAVESYATKHRQEAEQEARAATVEAEGRAKSVVENAEERAREIEEEARRREDSLRDETRILEERRRQALAGLRELQSTLHDVLEDRDRERAAERSVTDALAERRRRPTEQAERS